MSPLPKSRFPFPYKAVCSAGSVRKPLSKQRACRWPQGFSRDTAPGEAHFQSSCRPSAHRNCCPVKLLLSTPFASASEGKAYRKVWGKSRGRWLLKALKPQAPPCQRAHPHPTHRSRTMAPVKPGDSTGFQVGWFSASVWFGGPYLGSRAGDE